MIRQKVGIIMGSDSDFPVMEKALSVFDENNIEYEVRIISAHRTPEEMLNYAKEAKARGYSIIIAGAGGSAHLPGMVASMCSLPVIGVPVRTKAMAGIESVLSILQMPAGIPVATVGINNAKGAAKLAVRMIKAYDSVKAKPSAKILFDEKGVTEEGLEIVVETLKFYGLEYEIIKFDGKADSILQRKVEEAAGAEGMAILNLADISTEEISKATTLPVLTVPLKDERLDQATELKRAARTVEAVCEICDEMEVVASPVAMLAVNGYQNAGIMLARMAGVHEAQVYQGVARQLANLREQVMAKDAEMVVKFSK